MSSLGLWAIVIAMALFVLVLVFGFHSALKIVLGTGTMFYLIIVLLSGIMVSQTNYRLKVPGLSQKEIFLHGCYGALRDPAQAIRAIPLGRSLSGNSVDGSVASGTEQHRTSSEPLGGVSYPQRRA